METEILKKIQEQDIKIDAIYRSVEKMRKYFMWTFILSLVFFILPLLGLVFILPSVWSALTSVGAF